ncbi:ABC transporter, ATPase, predicted [Methanolacinia petrolearia DSM 11571]|uniref:ABC transporter, ATPase, predicted n=1 Tax=Methanolacinia petrolearia (strain DSM 11571 / OCM 486 / SEBR 4847) TaxID=679926 RepID=E1RDV6_METP4|nr:P-loop domain-containing protein [Methanolacinia petrolearia]ADN37143.1 ABC transporter, ATPase, predicted [Methanolacinia petrolearia DSM 11571]
MRSGSWSDVLPAILEEESGGDIAFEAGKMNPGVNTYLVRSYDRSALIFSFPAVIRCGLPGQDLLPDKRGYDGAVGAFIEEVKGHSRSIEGLRPLGGFDTGFPQNYSANIEPVTFCRSSFGAGQQLWKADSENYLDDKGVHVILSGALPYPGLPSEPNIRIIRDKLSGLMESVAEIVFGLDEKKTEKYALCSADQKMIREVLDSKGLVAFVGDGTRGVRTYTRHRGHFRVAGPNEISNIPFRCPVELEPVEMVLPASGGSITGLGIRKKEIFAVTGSNAQGKSTFLQVIRSGSDDHMPGDGRENVVTLGNVMTAESGEFEIPGADISMFFSALPPGMSGTPKNVYGGGSGSMVMAAMFQEAVRKNASLIVVDEDRSATNLLVPNCMQSEDVTPLSVICRSRREKLKGSSVIFAAATMDILVAEADRIMKFQDHAAVGILRDEFRSGLKRHLESVIRDL